MKHRNTDAAGQASDIRDLIAAGVQAIVFNPNDPEALNPALAEAQAQGIKTVSVDAYVTDPNTYNLYNNQVKYAEIGARWLFEQLGGKGKVWYTRGIAGNPADSDRDIGFKNALKDYPNIEVVPTADGVFTKWDPATATQLTNDFISSGQYDQIQGIWASGMGKQIVDSIKAANKPFVPIADADVGGFVTQLLDPTNFPGLKGAAVTNTAAVGGAGITLALKLLNGETVTTSTGAPQANTVLLDPVLLDNLTPDGQAALKAWQSVPGHGSACGRSACRSTAGRPTIRTRSPRPARARRPHLARPFGGPATPAPRRLPTQRSPWPSRRATCCSRPPALPRPMAPSWPCAQRRSRSDPARSTRSWARTAPARAPSSRSSAAPSGPTPARSPSAAASWPSARPARPAAAASSPSTRSRPSSPTSTSGRTCG